MAAWMLMSNKEGANHHLLLPQGSQTCRAEVAAHQKCCESDNKNESGEAACLSSYTQDWCHLRKVPPGRLSKNKQNDARH